MSDSPGFIGGSFLLYSLAILAAAGGIGGGAMNVPVLWAVFGYSYDDAVALSLCVVFGNAISQVAVNFWKRHPLDESRPIIYWDLVLFLIPSLIGGNFIGGVIAKLLSTTIRLVLAVIVVTFAVYKTYTKGVHLYELESASMSGTAPVHRMDSKAETMNLIQPLLADRLHSVDKEVVVLEGESSVTVIVSDDTDRLPVDHSLIHINEVRKRSLSKDVGNPIHEPLLFSVNSPTVSDTGTGGVCMTEQPIPMTVPTVEMLSIAVMMTVFILINVGKGLLNKCSAGWIAILLLITPVAVAMIYVSWRYISQKQMKRGTLLLGDVDFTEHVLTRPTLSFIIGITCSLLGIGGGELFGPLILSMNVIPQVSSGTTSVLSSCSSLFNIISHVIQGDLRYIAGITVGIVGALGGVTGRVGALHIVKMFGRPSFLIFTLAVILCISCVIDFAWIFIEDPSVTLANACE